MAQTIQELNNTYTDSKIKLMHEIKKEKTNQEILDYFSEKIKNKTNEDDLVKAWEKYKNEKSFINV